jgi:hypothetical protein
MNFNNLIKSITKEDVQNMAQDIVKQMGAADAKRQGLVPKTGNWQHPGRWVKPQQTQRSQQVPMDDVSEKTNEELENLLNLFSRDQHLPIYRAAKAEMEKRGRSTEVDESGEERWEDGTSKPKSSLHRRQYWPGSLGAF